MRSVFTYVFVICCLFIMINISGCGEETENNYAESDVGGADFRLIWPDEDSDQRTPQAIGNTTINCNDKGISFIRVDVYDGSFDKYLTGETFPCTDGEGTVYGIASGKDRIFKVSGKNNKGKLLYEGEKKGIEIVTGIVKPVGLINMLRYGNIPPTATIDTFEYGQNIVFIVGEKITFKGSGHDNEDGELTGDALVWTLDGNEIETGDTCTLSSLDIDSHKITLTVTDDDQATGHFSVTFSVKELDNENPKAIINLPLDLSKHDFASEIKFQGTGTDKESDTLIFEWDLDNEPLGTGRKFSKSDLPAGQHIVTLRVKDDAGGMGTATVRIEVLENKTPEAKINAIEKDTYIQGEWIKFIGTGTDKESTVLSYTWHLGPELKNIGTGQELEINNLPVGTHTITLAVTDEHDKTGTATINVTILKNQLPVATIAEPATGSAYIEGESVEFSGIGTDNDGSVTSFQWESSIDGNLGTKQTFTTSDLSFGTHTITLKVMDQYEGTGTTTIIIEVFKGFINSIGMTFIEPKTTFPASFLMGSPDGTGGINGTEPEPERRYNETLHEVTLTKPFFMQTTEVTNAQYVIFLNDVNKRGPEGELWFYTKEEYVDRFSPSSHITGDIGNFIVETNYENHPVTWVTWYGAKAFSDWLSDKENKDYQLPTEAEWEFAARANSSTPFYFGDCLSTEQANYNGAYPLVGCDREEDRDETIEVAGLGRKSANAWGLYDMHGNVKEWCQNTIEPDGPYIGDYRALRGGGWNSTAAECRSAYRNGAGPGGLYFNMGFRLVLHPAQ